MDTAQLKRILESLILASSIPLNLDRMLAVFPENEQPEREDLRKALAELADDYAATSMELKEVSSGYRFQVRKEYAEWVSKLWEEKPARYSRALLETLALVAYKQPITRGEIEKIRGVSVNTQIMKTLLERDWVSIVGHRDVPGKPAIYATTKQFLDYFNLKSLDDLPPLADIRDLDQINGELEFSDEGDKSAATDAGATDDSAGNADADKAGAEQDTVVNLDVDESGDEKSDVATAMTAEQ